MHKHFRMMALSNHMRSHGYKEEHTRIPGLWRKLETLYNVKMLDERVSGLTSHLHGTAVESMPLTGPFRRTPSAELVAKRATLSYTVRSSCKARSWRI